MKRPIVAVVVLIVLAAAGYLGWRYLYGGTDAGDSALGGSGTIESQQLAIVAQAVGRITSAPAEGAAVKAGDVLFRLDAQLLGLQVKQAEAGVAAAKAGYDNAVDDNGSGSPEAAVAKAQLDQANVALSMAKVQAGYATIAAPIDGTVTNVAANAGENTAPGSTLALMSDPASLTVTIYIAEDRIGEVRLGQKGALTTDSTDREYAVEVVHVASQAEFTPASIETKDQRVKLVYRVRLRIDDPDAALKAGMPADVTLR